jgi:hypothetical protein
MINWLKRLFCKHKHRTELFVDYQQDRYIMEKCNDCGKIICSDL